jgi:DNA replication protein DnaC
MVLACSRHMFVRPVLKMDQRAWTECHGPVGVGKSHVAQALAHLAIRAGAEARFTKTSRALAHLAGGRADRTWDLTWLKGLQQDAHPRRRDRQRPGRP